MSRFGAYLAVACIGALHGAPAGLEAQYRLRVSPEWQSAAPWSPEVTVLTSGVDQVQRLPVYDDAGVPILFEAIEARVDRSGVKGAFWGGLAGLVGGAILGTALSPRGCNHSEGGFYIACSPREDALRAAWPLGLSLVGMISLAWVGSNADITTWQEAVTEIRQERRLEAVR